MTVVEVGLIEHKIAIFSVCAPPSSLTYWGLGGGGGEEAQTEKIQKL